MLNGSLTFGRQPFKIIYLFGCFRSWLRHAQSLLHHVGYFIVAEELSSCGAWAYELLHCMWDFSSTIRD